MAIARRSTVTDAGNGMTMVGRWFCISVWIIGERLRSTLAESSDASETAALRGVEGDSNSARPASKNLRNSLIARYRARSRLTSFPVRLGIPRFAEYSEYSDS